MATVMDSSFRGMGAESGPQQTSAAQPGSNGARSGGVGSGQTSGASGSHATWSTGSGSHAVFAVEGMRCAGCSRSVERAVRALQGVDRISVNVATARAAVDWNPDRVSLGGILDAVRSAGFKPVPLAGAAAADLRRAERRTAFKRIGLAGLGMMQTMMFVYCLYAGGAHGVDPAIAQYFKLAGMLIATPVLLYSGAPFFRGAVRDLRRRTLGMDVPVALALALAYAASVVNTLRGTGEIYFDSVTMFVFFLLTGRFMEMAVRQRSLSATEALARSLPSTVARIRADGTTERVPVQSIEPGDRLSIPKGAVIAVDATLIDVEGLADESLVTGESVPIPKRAGEELLGGSVNAGHAIQVTARKKVADSMLASIVGLLERTQAERPLLARSADKVASWFVLVTLALALCVGLVWWFVEPSRAFPAALAVLVVTCPCALSLATPAVIAAATARLARLGLLVTRPDALERLAQVDVVVVDKTGTLTRGCPAAEIVGIREGHAPGNALAIAAALESKSDHPLAAAFEPFAHPALTAVDHREAVGRGVEARIGGDLWRLGRREFVTEIAGECADLQGAGIVLGNSRGLLASFNVTDSVRPDAAQAVRDLQAMGLQVVIASGDREETVANVARQLGVNDAVGRLSPEDKRTLVQERQRSGRRALMIGDGINDGPVLAAAHVSCAMAQGSAVAQAAADLLLLNDSLGAVAEAIRSARKARTTMRQNLGWAFVYNIAAVPLAAFGWIPPWIAAIGMSASSLGVVLNAARLARGSTAKSSRSLSGQEAALLRAAEPPATVPPEAGVAA